MAWNYYSYCTLAREKNEARLREAEAYRLARAATASRTAADQTDGPSAPRITARRFFWTRWGAQLASSLRLW